MTRKISAFFVPLVLIALIVLVTIPALAQTPIPTLPTPPPGPLSLSVAVVMVLSLLLGFVNAAVQSGSIFGIVTTPKAWLPELTLFGSFLGGVLAYFTGLGSAFTVTGTTIFYGVLAGLTATLTASVPAFARHAVSVMPEQIRLARLAAKKGG